MREMNMCNMERMRNISILVSKRVMTTRPSRRQTSEGTNMD